MPDITMTTFTDFANASGRNRVTRVREAIAQYEEPYHPARDFWRPLRIGIEDMHNLELPNSSLYDLITNLSDGKKINLYPPKIDAYIKWLGRKQISWAGKSYGIWEYEDLRVAVNPELVLDINGRKHVVKLYFKAEQLAKPRIDTILHLMQITMPLKHMSATPCVLDISRGKLHKPTVVIPYMDALLSGEAASFLTMWKSLDHQHNQGGASWLKQEGLAEVSTTPS